MKKCTTWLALLLSVGLTGQATDEVRAIPWIVPLLDSEDRHVRIYAGQALNAVVAAIFSIVALFDLCPPGWYN